MSFTISTAIASDASAETGKYGRTGRNALTAPSLSKRGEREREREGERRLQRKENLLLGCLFEEGSVGSKLIAFEGEVLGGVECGQFGERGGQLELRDDHPRIGRRLF